MLKDGFQTSETWVDMFSEMIAVNGAIYGITLSLVMCLAAVVIFTGNFKLSVIVFITIAGSYIQCIYDTFIFFLYLKLVQFLAMHTQAN